MAPACIMIQDADSAAPDKPPRELGHSAIVSVEFEVFGQVQGESRPGTLTYRCLWSAMFRKRLAVQNPSQN